MYRGRLRKVTFSQSASFTNNFTRLHRELNINLPHLCRICSWLLATSRGFLARCLSPHTSTALGPPHSQVHMHQSGAHDNRQSPLRQVRARAIPPHPLYPGQEAAKLLLAGLHPGTSLKNKKRKEWKTFFVGFNQKRRNRPPFRISKGQECSI